MVKFLPRVTLVIGLLTCFTYSYAQVRQLKIEPAKAKQIIDNKTSQVKEKGSSLFQSKKTTLKNKFQFISHKNSIINKDSIRSRFHFLNDFYSFKKDSTGNFKLPPPISLGSGRASLTQQIAKREGAYPALSPGTFTRFTFNGSVNIFSIPLLVNSLYSTEQSRNRQPMNRTGVSLDIESLKARIIKRIDEKIQILEKTTHTNELKDLDKLTRFYQNNKLDMGNAQELKTYLKELSIVDPTQKISGELLEQYGQSKDHLQDSIQYLFEQKKAHTTKKLSKKVKKHIESEKLDVKVLEQLQQKWDSLQKEDPERMFRYLDIATLKAIKEGKVSATNSIKTLKRFGLLSKTEALLGSIKSFGVGTSYPMYSRYTLHSMPISGLNFELQPGPLYIAYASSKNMQAIPEKKIYARNIQAGRLGLGQKEGNHFYANFLYGKDNKHSFRGDSVITGFIDTSFYDKPRENVVLGGEFRVKLKAYLALEGELAHSTTAMNIYTQDLSQTNFTSSLFSNSADTSGIRSGSAGNIQLKTNIGHNTLFTIKAEQISAGFHSLGTPYLRNDISGYELKAEHHLWKRQISIFPYYGRWKDNLSNTKASTTFMDNYGAKLKIAIKKLPYLVINYVTNHMQGSTMTNVTKVFNVNTGYHYKLGRVNYQTTIAASMHENKNSNPESKLNSYIKNIMCNQVLSFDFPVSLSGNISYMDAAGTPQNGKWITYGGNISYIFRGNWQNSIGFVEGTNHNSGKRQNRFVESRTNLWRHGDIAFRIEKNLFETGDELHDYKELVGSITLTGRF